MTDRSPNFPSISLADAIIDIEQIYAAEGKSKAPRLSIVKPLGYTSINGRSLGILGALKAYGLIEGRGDDLRVSADGFALAVAPPESEEYGAALEAAFRAPSAFQRFTDEDAGASADTMKWKLQRGGFSAEAAERLVKVYRESRDLVISYRGGYSTKEDATPPATKEGFLPSLDEMMDDVMPPPGKGGVKDTPAAKARADQTGLAMGVHERVLQSGMLSKAASYRVIVSGPVGEAEIDRLLRKLEMDREILADPDPEPSPEPEEDLIG